MSMQLVSGTPCPYHHPPTLPTFRLGLHILPAPPPGALRASSVFLWLPVWWTEMLLCFNFAFSSVTDDSGQFFYMFCLFFISHFEISHSCPFPIFLLNVWHLINLWESSFKK